jgi:hypothetical protein
VSTPSLGSVYGPDRLSCGITKAHPLGHTLLQFLPVSRMATQRNKHRLTLSSQILLASLISSLVYSFNFLVLRGTLRINGGLRLSLSSGSRWNEEERNYQQHFINSVSQSLLWYADAISFYMPLPDDLLIGFRAVHSPFSNVCSII